MMSLLHDDLLYAFLDGRHTALMDNKREAETFLFHYCMKLAPNKTLAKAFHEAYTETIQNKHRIE